MKITVHESQLRQLLADLRERQSVDELLAIAGACMYLAASKPVEAIADELPERTEARQANHKSDITAALTFLGGLCAAVETDSWKNLFDERLVLSVGCDAVGVPFIKPLEGANDTGKVLLDLSFQLARAEIRRTATETLAND
jgi:hypothetical protein